MFSFLLGVAVTLGVAVFFPEQFLFVKEFVKGKLRGQGVSVPAQVKDEEPK